MNRSDNGQSLRLRPGMVTLSLLAFLLPVGILWLLRGPEVERAVGAFPPLALLAATVTHLLWLGVRSEAWRLSVNAIEHPIQRLGAHAASAVGYVVGTVQSASGLPVRAVALGRIDRQAPTIDRTVVAEAPVITLEAGLIAVIFVTAVGGSVPLPLWGALATIAGCLLLVLLMAVLARRYSGHRAVAGLRVLADRSRCGPLLAAVTVMAALGLTRAWIVLLAAGLPHGPASVAVLYATLGLLGALPLGPGASPGALLAVFGPVDAAAAAGAGQAMAVSSMLAVAIYAVLAGSILAATRGARGPQT